MHSTHQATYGHCRRSAADAVALVRDGDSIIVPTGVGEPPALLAALSDRRRSLPYSGTGGQADFVRAANRSRGGKAFIVLPSTARNDTLSRIVPVLSPGSHVSTGKNEVNYVVTEYGVAQLRGQSARQRAAALIGIAHPRFRDELVEQARRLGLA